MDYGGECVRIAIAGTEQIEQNAGRASRYSIYENGTLVKVLKNPFAVGGGGAGFGVAHLLAQEGVEKVVAGRFGPNMLGALDEKGIAHEERTGSVSERGEHNA